MKIIEVTNHQTISLTEPGEYQANLTQPGARAEVHGRFLADQQANLAVKLTIVHQSPHTSAHTVLRGVAKDKGQLHFFGHITIEENCPDTQSFLEERILLLSDTAQAEAVPELEIKSDDVKCSHAASISHIPAEQLFYLESRGLTETAAEKIIITGFLAPFFESPRS